MRTGVGRFHSSMYKWGLAPSPNCECGTTEQTAHHVIFLCLIHHVPRGTRGLQALEGAINVGLISPLPVSDLGSAAAWGGERINPRPWP